MKTHTIYDNVDGTVLHVVSCPDSMLGDQVGVGEASVEGEYPASDYYVNVGTGTPVEKATNPSVFDKTTAVSDGVDAVTISSIPVGSEVIFGKIMEDAPSTKEESVVVNDGVLVVTFHLPENVRVLIRSSQMKDKEVNVYVT